MKILHVVWSLEVAGAEKLAYDMVHALPHNRFVTIVCSVNNGGILGDRLRKEGYTVYHRDKKPGLDWSTVKWLRELIVSEQVDVVHAHQYSPMIYSVLAAFWNRKLTIIYTEHGRTYPEERRWKRTLVNPLLARRIDNIISISENTRKAMIDYDKLPSGRIRVIHNGVDFNLVRGTANICEKRRELEIPDGYGVVGTAARLDEVKNLPMMLRAFQHVVANSPKTLLLIAGTGTLENQLKKLSRELGIEDNLRFVGLRHDLPDLMKIFNVFLLSSFTEGLSITLLEAMANGIPTVVTDVGGNPEVVVNGETGYLVPLGDDTMMASKILELLDHPKVAGEMGTKGMERVAKNFSFSRMMLSYLDVYGVDEHTAMSIFKEAGATI